VGQGHRPRPALNGHALYSLRAALDYLEATPLARIDIDHGYLANLTAHEKSEERRLLSEVVSDMRKIGVLRTLRT